MAIIKKTITGLKPGTNYLFSLKPKNTEISAVDPIPDTIRVQTPGVASTPSSITGVVLAANYKSAMLRFNHASIVDLDYYEYKIYLADDLTETALKARASTIDGYMVSGMTKSNLVVISDLDNTTLIGTNQTNVAYKAKVRAVNTGGNAGSWSSASNSSTTELIESQFVKDLTAAKITAGTIGAQEIILTNSAAPSTYTPPSGTAVLRSSDYVAGSTGWIIRGDGTAEFGSASIRGTLAAETIYLDAYNRWGRNSTNTADETNVFVVGKDANSQIYWDGNTLTVKGSLVTGNTVTGGSVGGVSVGTDKIYLGTGTYGNSNTPFFVGIDSGVNKFSIGSSLTFDGTTLSIGGTNATTVVSGAASGSSALQAGNGVSQNSSKQITQISGSGVTITSNGNTSANRVQLDSNGLKAYNSSGTNTVSINSDGSASFLGSISSGSTITGSTITGGTIQNAASSANFKVTPDGNVAMNNILATGSLGGSDTGLQIRADGTSLGSGDNQITATSGSIFIYHGSNASHQIRLGESTQYFYINQLKSQPTGPANVTRLQSSVNAIQIDARYTGIGGRPSNSRVLLVHGDISLAEPIDDDANCDFLSVDISSTASTNNPIHFKTINGVTGLFGTNSLRSGKENIDYINDSETISIIKKLTPRKYTVKPDNPEDELEVALKSLDIYYGFVAEEVEESVPQLATYKTTKEFQKLWPNVNIEDIQKLPLTYYKETSILSLCVSSIQNLLSRVEYLEAQLATQ